jgi:hypothetical protein
VNRLLLMMNVCTFKNIFLFRVFVKSVEPNINKSVFKLIGKLMFSITKAIGKYQDELEESKESDIIKANRIAASHNHHQTV